MKTLIVVMLSAFCTVAVAKSRKPRINCTKQVMARKEARKALYNCEDDWARDFRADDPDPSDDCKEKLDNYIKAAQEIKICKGGVATPPTEASPSPSNN